MAVVKLKEDRQKVMKNVSKAVYIVSKVIQVCMKIACVCIILAMAFVPVVICNVEVKDDEITLFGETIKYEIKDSNLIFSIADESDKITDAKVVELVQKSIEKYKKNRTLILVSTEIIIALAVGTLVLITLLFKNIESLFRNLCDGNTPFTMENVSYINKMVNCIFLIIITSFVTNIFAGVLLEYNYNIGINGMHIVFILSLIVLSCIFEYGVEIQKDSKGVIYNEK